MDGLATNQELQVISAARHAPEPPPGSGQNTGVGGTTHTVAPGPAGDGRTARPPRPIRYAHTRAGDGGTGDERTGDGWPGDAPAATVPVEITDVPARGTGQATSEYKNF